MDMDVQNLMRKKERMVNLIMAVTVSAVMGLIFAIFARIIAAPEALKAMPPAPVMIISSIIESVIVGVIIAFILPLGKLGKGLAARCNANPPGMKFNLINAIPFAVVNAIVVSAIVIFISIAQARSHMPAAAAPPIMAMWFSNWIKTLPLSIIVSYIISIIVSPVLVKAVGLGGPMGPKGKDNN